MTLLFIVGIVLIVAGISGAVWYFAAARSCNPPLPTQTIQVGQATFTAEMATTMMEQSCGLSGRVGLDNGHGMLFVFGSGRTQTFWMKDMNFALDMVWISGNTVAGFAQNVPPPAPGTQIWQLQIYSSPPNVDKVLELPAGTVAKDGIKVGDMVAGV